MHAFGAKLWVHGMCCQICTRLSTTLALHAPINSTRVGIWMPSLRLSALFEAAEHCMHSHQQLCTCSQAHDASPVPIHAITAGLLLTHDVQYRPACLGRGGPCAVGVGGLQHSLGCGSVGSSCAHKMQDHEIVKCANSGLQSDGLLVASGRVWVWSTSCKKPFVKIRSLH